MGKQEKETQLDEGEQLNNTTSLFSRGVEGIGCGDFYMSLTDSKWCMCFFANFNHCVHVYVFVYLSSFFFFCSVGVNIEVTYQIFVWICIFAHFYLCLWYV